MLNQRCQKVCNIHVEYKEGVMKSPAVMSIEEIEEELKELERKEQKGQDVHERIRVLLEELTKRDGGG